MTKQWMNFMCCWIKGKMLWMVCDEVEKYGGYR